MAGLGWWDGLAGAGYLAHAGGASWDEFLLAAPCPILTILFIIVMARRGRATTGADRDGDADRDADRD